MDLIDTRKLPAELVAYIQAARNMREYLINRHADPDAARSLVFDYDEAADHMSMSAAIDALAGRPTVAGRMRRTMVVLIAASTVLWTLAFTTAFTNHLVVGLLFAASAVITTVASQQIFRRIRG